MKGGATVALVSDAGMPGLSDPGYRLVSAAVDAGISTEVVPGPSAAISALAISGLAPGRFVFEGFLPRKSGERKRHLEELVDEKRTLVFYESPHRIADALADLADVFGDRPAALARELTKLHEEVVRGTLPELAEFARKEPPRGEITLVVAGAVGESKLVVDPGELARRARALMEQGVDRKEAMLEVRARRRRSQARGLRRLARRVLTHTRAWELWHLLPQVRIPPCPQSSQSASSQKWANLEELGI